MTEIYPKHPGVSFYIPRVSAIYIPCSSSNEYFIMQLVFGFHYIIFSSNNPSIKVKASLWNRSM